MTQIENWDDYFFGCDKLEDELVKFDKMLDVGEGSWKETNHTSDSWNRCIELESRVYSRFFFCIDQDGTWGLFCKTKGSSK